MLYTLDERGPRIAGWILPDNPSVEPAVLVVYDDGRGRVRIPATLYRSDVQNTGWHETGRCGFLIDAESCPGFDPDRAFEVYDGEANILMLRRGPPNPAPLRLFHLETQTSPVFQLGELLLSSVQMIYSSVELMGEQSLVNLMGLTFPSVVISGGVLYKSFEPVLQRHDYKRSILLSDPFRDLACRLLRARMLASEEGAATTWRGLGQAALIQAFRDVDLTDGVAIGRALKRLGDEDFFALANPTVRKLATKVPNERLQAHHVGQALDSLAMFDLVGFDDQFETFLEGLEALSGRAGLIRNPDHPPELAAVMAALRGCRPARELVLLDEHLTYLALTAFEKVQEESVPA